ncbi:MAG: prepilin-type N-terminal cleavage/methylation domain-containing protein [Phycisphaerales bacterium]|nr:prepilin-type N-terminal cleavage/methylation domain-containing protein [Phycisphaerales bacterium]
MRRTRRAAPRARRSGFTLIETALATVIIGVGVLALVESQQAFIKSNGWSTHAATATYLANEIRELSRRMPRHDPVTGLFSQNVSGTATLRGWGPETGETTIGDFDDIDDFDGLTISYVGTAGLDDSDLPGPIDAFGQVIPQINNDGTAALDGEGNPLPLQGWSQVIQVQKVNPADFSVALASDAVIAPDGTGFNGVAIDAFPLRVTVTVRYRGVYDTEDQTVAVVSWIVP